MDKQERPHFFLQAKAELLADTFAYYSNDDFSQSFIVFKQLEELEAYQPNSYVPSIKENLMNDTNSFLSMEELKEVIINTRYSCPGPDGIPPVTH